MILSPQGPRPISKSAQSIAAAYSQAEYSAKASRTTGDHHPLRTPYSEIEACVVAAHAYFNSDATRPLAARRALLGTLRRLLTENEQALVAALREDGGRAEGEVYITEISVAHNDITYALNNLEAWAAGSTCSRPLTDWLFEPTVATIKKASVVPEPLGVVVIIGAWNYPLILLLRGLVVAIAAGNAVILKPSDVAPRTAILLSRIVPVYFPEGAVGVVNGSGTHETAELLRFKSHHILYTGSSRGARPVLEAAARFMTPVTLELGGKCPVVVDQGFSKDQLDKVARKVLWAKCLNAGQTCVAPDYVLVREEVKFAFLGALKSAYLELYCGNARTVAVGANPPLPLDHYTRIANRDQFKRLVRLLRTPDNGELVFGGRHDEAELYIEPTVLHNIPANAPILREEIFGPILPIITFRSVEDVIRWMRGSPQLVGDGESDGGTALSSPLRGGSLASLHLHETPIASLRSGVPMEVTPSSREYASRMFLRETAASGYCLETPLAAYVFSPSPSFVEALVPTLHVGGVTVNDVLLHAAHPHLPFGGVGSSGMGAYSGGFHGFQRFSHWKPVAEAYLVGPFATSLQLRIGLFTYLSSLRFPPYTKEKRRTIARMTDRRVHGPIERRLWRLWAAWGAQLSLLLLGVLLGALLSLNVLTINSQLL